jgi:transposase InsO family protein
MDIDGTAKRIYLRANIHSTSQHSPHAEDNHWRQTSLNHWPADSFVHAREKVFHETAGRPGRLSVATTIDLFSRRLIGWSMKAEMTVQPVADAFIMAIWRRRKPDSLLRRSDQGS